MKEGFFKIYQKLYRLLILPAIFLLLGYWLMSYLSEEGNALSMLTQPWCVAMILMVINHIYLEHLFTTPRDGLVNSLNALIIAIVFLFTDTSTINFWIVFSYSTIVFLSGLIFLLSYDRYQKITALTKIPTYFGRAKVIFPFVVLISLTELLVNSDTFQFAIRYDELKFIAAYYFLFLVLTDPNVIEWVKNIPSKIFQIIYAERFGIVSGNMAPNIFIAHFSTKSNIKINDLVIVGEMLNEKDGEFDKENENRLALVLDFIGMATKRDSICVRLYMLNEPQRNLNSSKSGYVKVGTECRLIREPQAIISRLEDGRTTYYWQRRADISGIVSPTSNINILKAEILRYQQLENAELVSIINNYHDRPIRYQIIEAETFRETNEEKRDHGFTQITAYQLGEWKKPDGDIAAFHQFSEFPWVPNLNTLVFKWNNEFDEADIEETGVDKTGYYLMGTIPKTSLPIYVNVKELVSHHTAILGVTGSGKSTLVFKLLNEITSNDILTICIDITGEYRNKIGEFEPFFDEETRNNWTQEIKGISETRRKKSLSFNDNQRITPEEAEELERKHIKNIEKAISDRIIKLRELKKKVIFEIFEISNTKISIDCTQYFIQGLLEYAKTLYETNLTKELEHRDNFQSCLVLEEAHTLVPENLGVGGRFSESQAVIDKISQIALQGRKYNVGFLLISQRTATVKKTVLNQCNTMISFRAYDETSFNFLSSYFGDDYVREISHLKNDGDSRYVIAAGKAIVADRPVIVEIKK